MEHSRGEMSVYRLRADDAYHAFMLASSVRGDFFYQFDGSPLARSWKPVAITAADEDDELALLADHMQFGTVSALSERAVDVLRPVLAPHGELLPLDYERAPYWLYNVTAVRPALDEPQSELLKLPSGSVFQVNRWEFIARIVDGETIFKIPQLPRAFVFVTTPFVSIVSRAGLTGFSFEQIWSK